MSDTITKLYIGLTLKERAALAFEYIAELNDPELDRVVATVPVKTYEILDIEFRQRFDGIWNMATQFSIEHWRAHARSFAATMGLHIALKSKDLSMANTMLEAHSIWETRLLALDCSLLAVCEDHGIDPAAVRRLAGTELFVPLCANLKPDAKYFEETKANFLHLLGAI